MLQLFRVRPGLVGSALLLGGLVLAAPEVSWASERCTTKPMVCARLKAERAQRGAVTSPQPVLAAATPAQRAPAVALNADARCRMKPSVCARLRNEEAARGPSVAPLQLASSAPASERCTTKPMVCARLKSGPAQRPMTMASEPGPSAVD